MNARDARRAAHAAGELIAGWLDEPSARAIANSIDAAEREARGRALRGAGAVAAGDPEARDRVAAQILAADALAAFAAALRCRSAGLLFGGAGR